MLLMTQVARRAVVGAGKWAPCLGWLNPHVVTKMWASGCIVSVVQAASADLGTYITTWGCEGRVHVLEMSRRVICMCLTP